MKIHYHYERNAGLPPVVLAIGFFDGFHRGHQAIVSELRTLRKPGYRTAILTFANHPATFLRPDSEPPLLTTPEERIDLLAQAGVEECFFVPFDERMASMSPQAFVNEVLVQKLAARAVVVGANFRFGKGRAGDITFAREALTAHAIPIMAIENAVEGGERISSTRIRALILEGRMEEAQALLGHAFEVRGRVVLGAGRGHDLGFPTANVEPATAKIHPKDGVYAAMARYDGRDYPALVSIGTNPTFGGVKRTIEAWLRDFDRSIYGEELALREFRFVRDQVRFANAQELVAQMEKDLTAVAYPSYG